MKRTPLRARDRTDHSNEPGYEQYKRWVWAECAICGKRMLCLRHHVVLEQHVRAAGGNPYDLRNSILIGAGYDCACHQAHHHATRRIALSKLAPEAVDFTMELLGQERGADYLARHYSR